MASQAFLIINEKTTPYDQEYPEATPYRNGSDHTGPCDDLDRCPFHKASFENWILLNQGRS